MSLYKNRAAFDVLRTGVIGSVSPNFVAIGSPLTAPTVSLTFKNTMDGDIVVSTNGIDDMLYIPANSYNVFDIKTNGPEGCDYMFEQGTQFYFKHGTLVPTAGNFYIEAIIVQRR